MNDFDSKNLQFGQILQNHILNKLSPLDWIHIMQTSKYYSSLVPAKKCIDYINTKIKDTLKIIFSKDYDWIMQLMIEYDMYVSGRFIWQCVIGVEMIQQIRLNIGGKHHNIHQMLIEKGYIGSCDRICAKHTPSGAEIYIAYDSNKNCVDLFNNNWRPTKLYFPGLFDAHLAEVNYDILCSHYVKHFMSYYKIGYKFVKEGHILSDTEVRQGMNKFLNVERWDRVTDYDTAIRNQIESDPWYKLVKPIVWSNGYSYIVRYCKNAYWTHCNIDFKKVCDSECLSSFVYPGVKHFHFRSFAKLPHKQDMIILNDFA
uniref:F-box domain-containing protein n=1 Tax=viral metagenome TaxID=1070528 RepID=A0A6C0C5Y3_9ZZZZ